MPTKRQRRGRHRALGLRACVLSYLETGDLGPAEAENRWLAFALGCVPLARLRAAWERDGAEGVIEALAARGVSRRVLVGGCLAH
jgi:hypothetical protein